MEEVKDPTTYNVGASDYAKHVIQPYDIWEEYVLDPWDADIVKRILRKKQGEEKEERYLKIKHICDYQLKRIKEGKK